MERKSADEFFADAATIISKPWHRKTVLEKSYTAAAALLLVAVFPMPYEYYLTLRLGICACLYFFYSAAKSREDLNPAWTYGLIGFAVLYNPVLPIHLGVHSVWTIINIATIFFLYRLRRATDTPAGNTKNTVAENRQRDTTVETQQLAARDGFDDYRSQFIDEVKRLSGKAKGDLHWVELADDEGTRRAYADGVNPKLLAAAFLKHGKPPLPHEISD